LGELSRECGARGLAVKKAPQLPAHREIDPALPPALTLASPTRMNIVVLDEHTLNPGDLNWDALRALGACTIHERTPATDIVAHARAAAIVLTNKTPLRAEPPPADHPLLTGKNCLITPHNSWATRAARARLRDTAVANVRAFLAGTPQHVVN
jgi:hypothetical protein